MTSIPEWLKTDHPREVIEAALAHVVRVEPHRRLKARREATDDRTGRTLQHRMGWSRV